MTTKEQCIMILDMIENDKTITDKEREAEMRTALALLSKVYAGRKF